MFNASCIYSLTFESIVPKNNATLRGRERISHPIIIDTDEFAGKELASFVVNLIFLGKAVNYLPYFFYALKKGGESGITKERVPYEISDIIDFSNSAKRCSLKIDDGQLNTQIEPESWEYIPTTETMTEKELRVNLITPLRFKAEGHYARRLTELEFVGCLHRRTQVLSSQYGHNDYTGEYRFLENWAISEQNLEWKDFVHYSSRQKRSMQLGGLVGNFVLSGRFSSYEIELLRFAGLFHGGKNTNFGLGKMAVMEYGRL